jgi:hypothetical protein
VKNLGNFLLFQLGWFACTDAAAAGRMWLGPFVAATAVALHLALVSPPKDHRRELTFIFLVGLLGTLIDTGLHRVGVTHYPSSEAHWPWLIVPPWISALWVLFATLPFHSLRWLAGRPWLAALLGAIGGPLSYLGGVKMGAVGVGEMPLLTWGGLALEYAVVTPLLLWPARPRSASAPAPRAA